MTTAHELISNNLFDAKGAVAVVTGGGTGICLMATQGLVAKGARVYIINHHKEAIDQVVKKYSPRGGPGQIIANDSIQADITNETEV